MSVYIDPKDQEITTDDATLYKAWIDRKELRHKHFVMSQEIKALDDFISMYVARVQPKYQNSLSQVGISTTFTTGAAPAPGPWVTVTT